MYPLKLNRNFAVVYYIFWSVIAILATIECFYRGVWFHIIIFSIFIFSCVTGIIAASRHMMDVEIRVVKVFLCFGAGCFFAMFLLLPKVDLDWLIRNWIIIIFFIIRFYYRLCVLRWLQSETKKAVDIKNGSY